MSKEAVVLVHGLWLSGWSMGFIARQLRRHGYTTYQFSYPTVRNTLRENAEALRAFSDSIEDSMVHFVGHSLGGVVIRAMLYHCAPARPGRVVTLGSPHDGSRVAQVLSQWNWGKKILGLGIADVLRREPPVPDLGGREFGLIKGDLPIGLGVLFVGVKRPGDGIVLLEETDVVGATDRITLHVSHTAMLFSRAVCKRTAEFLQHGRFLKH